MTDGPVLITGATGFAGTHLAHELATRHEVVGWRRSDSPVNTAVSRWQQVNLLDREQVERALREVRPAAVFHCAGAPNVGASWSDTRLPLAGNALATHRLLDAIRRARITSRVLVTGSATVYAPSPEPVNEDHPLAPASPYAVSKLAQEQLALRAAAEDGLDVVVARAFNHTGPGQSQAFVAPSIAAQIAAIERGELEPIIRVGNIDTRRDLSDVRDVVRAYVALMESGTRGQVYNVASGTSRSIRSILEALVARARVPVQVVTDPARVRSSDTSVLVGDNGRLRRETGWAPSIPFERTLDDLLDNLESEEGRGVTRSKRGKAQV